MGSGSSSVSAATTALGKRSRMSARAIPGLSRSALKNWSWGFGGSGGHERMAGWRIGLHWDRGISARPSVFVASMGEGAGDKNWHAEAEMG